MKKTKLTALFLALVLTLSLATPAFALSPAPPASNNPSPTTATGAYGGNPYAPVILGVGTTVVEDKAGLVHIFLEDETVVTMSEQFILNYTAAASGYKSRSFSSKSGYAWLAQAAIDRALTDKTVASAADGKSCTYGEKAIHLSTASGNAMEIDYIIANYFRQPVKNLRTLDTVTYNATYKNGKTAAFDITVRAYGDATPSASTPTTPGNTVSAGTIWKVREVDDYTIEVYLLNGMIVTLPKQMVIDWVDARQYLGKTFGVSSWHDRYEMDDEGAETCVSFCQNLLDELILQGWTVFPPEALEPGYTYRAFPATDVMWPGVTADLVLIRPLERLRTADTTSNVTIYFDYANQYGRWTHSVSYQMSFEFLCRSRTPSANSTTYNFNFYSLAKPEYFMLCYNAAQKAAGLTDAEIKAISR